MAETKNTASATGATGRIVRIVGAVVDVEFPPDQMPAIYNALTVDATTPIGEVKTVLEVQTHLPGDLVRTVAMSSTDGMVRGLEVVDTGNPGKYVKMEDTIRSFAEILDGKCDHIPEQCFVYKGAIEDVYAAYEEMTKEEAHA